MSLHSERLDKELSALQGSEARARLQGLFDDGVYTELDRFAKSGDGVSEVVAAFGSVQGCPCYAFAQDRSVSAGAMGREQAAKIRRVYQLAEKTGYPVVGIYDSNGAHLDEGLGALEAYAELIQLSNRLSGVVPQIAVIAGTCAGSAAVHALCADVVVMAETAELFVHSAQLVGDRSGKIGTAAAAAASGTAHLCAADVPAALTAARELVGLLPANNLSAAAAVEYAPAAAAAAEGMDPAALIAALADADSALALLEGFGNSAKTVLARIGGLTAGIAAVGGRLSGDDCRKLAYFVRLCDAFSIPVVTLMDTEGYAETAEEEAAGQVKDAALLTQVYAEATTAKITVVTGKAYGPAFITFAGKAACADAVFAWSGAVISALRPETAVSILYNEKILAGEDRQALMAAYEADEASAFAAAAAGYIDDVIAPEDTFARVMSALDMLASKRVSTLDKKHTTIAF